MNPLWNELASRAGITLDETRQEQLERYLALLIEANQRMNLTRITDLDAARIQHIGDALTLLPFLPKDAHQLADVGSGGGMPGMALAIARPDARAALIEATGKKADFLRSTAAALGLTNVSVQTMRAEEAGRSLLRETFDVAVARAVGTMDWLVEWCLPLVKRGGFMLAMKGPRVHDELPGIARSLKFLGGATPKILPANLPGAEQHVIVKIDKKGLTDPRFPRLASVAKAKPMGT